jgi:signal transduction histidine kinase
MPTGHRKQQGKARKGSSENIPKLAPGESELRPFAHPVSDVLVLASLDRAERHRGRGANDPGVLLGDVFAHMGFVYNGAATRQLRPRLDALLASGALGNARRHSLKLWVLTSAGRRQLAQARRKGEVWLPESPQHRRWRHTRALAAARIERYREQLRDLLNEADALLEAGMQPHSDTWFSLSHELPRPSANIGAAIYCLMEWAEPDDAHADTDDYSDPNDENLDTAERGHTRYLRTGRRHAILRNDDV